MQTSQHVALGERMIVLYEMLADAQLHHDLLVIALQKESARIAEDSGLQDEHAFERGSRLLHHNAAGLRDRHFKTPFLEGAATDIRRTHCFSLPGRCLPALLR